MLEDRTLLRELEAELVVLLRPGAPDWADELGFDGDFGAHLRDYWAKHGQDWSLSVGNILQVVVFCGLVVEAPSFLWFSG